MRELPDALWKKLAAAVPGLALNGHREHRLPNTVNVRFPGVLENAVLTGASEVAASTGSACHEGHDNASSVITAMGVPPEKALGSVRLTVQRRSHSVRSQRTGASCPDGLWRRVERRLGWRLLPPWVPHSCAVQRLGSVCASTPSPA